MGAVFAIFSGFYFWFEKMWGIQYSEFLGRLHFTLFFIGVNVTFFPMHFLGLAGMPRRISDYNDAYSQWNSLASAGAMISVVATLVFFVLMFLAFYNSTPVRTSGYTVHAVILPAKLLRVRNIDISKVTKISGAFIFFFVR
jgi:cytochrome c oxidase subunit 1